MNDASASEPKTIIAKDQVRLGVARCLQLAISGMVYRMFRSSVTVAILALAVAFVVHMLSFSLIEHETEHKAYLELQHSRRLGQDNTRLGTPDSSAMVLDVPVSPEIDHFRRRQLPPVRVRTLGRRPCRANVERPASCPDAAAGRRLLCAAAGRGARHDRGG